MNHTRRTNLLIWQWDFSSCNDWLMARLLFQINIFLRSFCKLDFSLLRRTNIEKKTNRDAMVLNFVRRAQRWVHPISVCHRECDNTSEWRRKLQLMTTASSNSATMTLVFCIVPLHLHCAEVEYQALGPFKVVWRVVHHEGAQVQSHITIHLSSQLISSNEIPWSVCYDRWRASGQRGLVYMC